MGYIVYIDIYFILNICIDYILLRVYGKVSRRKAYKVRQVIASMFGGVGAALDVLKIPFPSILIVLIMIIIAFPGMKKVEIIKTTVYFYILSLLVGGGIFFLTEQGITVTHIWQVLLGVFVIALCIEKGANSFFIQARIIKNLYSIDLIMGKLKVSGIALLDTGNCLYDPFFHRPVMIAEYQLVKEMYDQIQEEKVIWIPYHSLGKDHGLIPAMRADELIVYKEKEAISNKNVLVAIAKKGLSSKNQYQFILHEDYMRA
ncbi:MAG: sigma-E processing peptidase SpoIIGA [Velocimicrobium sp.]